MKAIKNLLQFGFKLLEGKGIGKIPLVDKLFHTISSLTGEIEYELEGLRFKSLMYYYPKRHLLYYGRSHEPDVRKVFCSLIRKGDIVVDVGASIGLYTLLAAKLVGSDGFVYAFEPDPVRFSKLLENVKLNNFKNVKAFDIALSNRKDYIKITYHHPRKGFVKGVVKALPLDIFKIEPDVIKIDVDGAEVEILEGMRETIENYRPTIICEIHPDEADITKIEDFLHKQDYTIYEIGKGGRLSYCQTIKDEHTNYVFIHERCSRWQTLSL